MKKIITSFIIAFLSLSIFAQQNPANEAMVYFQSGVTRNPDNTAIITSQNILNVLTNLNISVSNVLPAFPEFNESDTIISFPEFPNEPVTKEMNRTKVYRIICIDTFQRNQLITNLLTLNEVLFAEANGTADHNFIPSDTRFNEQWGLRNTAFPGRNIHAEQAWDIFRGTVNNIIAIIDWGSNSGHPDLQVKIVLGDAGFNANNHGIHVAGIAAALSNNNLGISGVDHFALIHPQRVDGLDDRGMARAVTDAVRFTPNVRVLNNSWGLTNGIDEFGNSIPGRYSTVVRSGFATAYKQNRVSCIAMGNHNQYSGARYANVVAFPAGFNTGSLAVGATTIVDGVAGFSARGAHIDVSAPGVDILSTIGTNDYLPGSGTSMAAPHVSGLASLLRGFNTNLANDDIEQIIRLTADDANILNFPGF
jgi:thermitase